MGEQERGAMRASVDFPELEAATPPRRPSPMPRQTVVFWTPRRVVTESFRALAAPRWLPRITRSAVIPIAKIDEPR